MQFQDNVTLLRVEAYDYDFNGRKGTAHTARVLKNGLVVKVKCSKEVYDDLKGVVEAVGLATFEVRSPKENTQVFLTGFVA